MIITKFKKTEEDKVYISYLPVLGWLEANLRKDAMVPGRENTIGAGSLYSVVSEYIIQEYGIVQKFLFDEEIEHDILQEEEDNSEIGNIESYYIYFTPLNYEAP